MQSQTLRYGVGLSLTIVVAFLGLVLAERSAAAKARAGQEPATTPADCASCHEDAVSSVERTGHVALDRAAAAGEQSTHSCSSCHGDPTTHLADFDTGSLFLFDAPAATNAQRCLTCHVDAHPRYLQSEHGRAGLDCSSCHVSHPEASPQRASGDLAGRPSEGCVTCHEDALAQFEFSERHRLVEGTLECTSCHDPHEPSNRIALAGFKQESCVSCHTDKGGPFVFEHDAQRVEGCVSCHAPHGSPNRHMLNIQRVAEQCYSCHAFVPGFHTRFTAETQCTSCHVTIHGSNLDPAFLR